MAGVLVVELPRQVEIVETTVGEDIGRGSVGEEARAFA